VISAESPGAFQRTEPVCVTHAMSGTRPSPDATGGTDKKNSGVEHDVAETIHAGTDHVARCPECGRETLWVDREHLTHRQDCPYWEVNRQ